jgi:prepilin signal peptidase PulO-like enzyme (type II secretory pathway)
MTETSALLFLVAFGIPVSYFDIKSKSIPNWLTALFLLCCLGFGALWIQKGALKFPQAIWGCLIASVIFFLLYFVSRGALGEADLKLAPGIGILMSVFSFTAAIWWILFAFILAGGFAAIMLLLRRLQPKQEFAFGPFMFLGALITTQLMQIY